MRRAVQSKQAGPVAEAEQEDAPWIDLHPHLFNASDLPVKQFIAKTQLWRNSPVSWTAGRIAEHMAKAVPDAKQDTDAIEQLLKPVRREVTPHAPAPKVPWSKRYWRMIGEAQISRLQMLRNLHAMTRDDPDEGGRPVDLYVPLGVDLETNLGGLSATSPTAQFDVIELLSEATLRGHPGEVDGVVLPMVGFDPLRIDESRNSFTVLQERVRSGRAIGFKLYPPMGFKPFGNALEVDRRLHALYAWCCENDVPIVAHCSPANAVKGAEEYAKPWGWDRILRDYDNLRLDLAHVGGIVEKDGLFDRKGWVEEAIAVIDAHHPRVFADVGNHDHGHHRVEHFVHRLQGVIETASDPGGVRGQIAFGTDYWFLYMHDDPQGFLHSYVNAFETEFGVDSLAEFASGAAQRFLGLTEPARGNRVRVIDRLKRMQTEPRGRFPVRDSLRKVLALTEEEIRDIETASA